MPRNLKAAGIGLSPLCGGAGSAGHVCIGAGCSARRVDGSSQRLPVGGGMLAAAVCAAVARLRHTKALQPHARGITFTFSPSEDSPTQEASALLKLHMGCSCQQDAIQLADFPKQALTLTLPGLSQQDIACAVSFVYNEISVMHGKGRTPEKGVQTLMVQPSSGAVLACVWK